MALGLFCMFYGGAYYMAVVRYSGLRYSQQTFSNFHSFLYKLRMRNNTILYPMGEKALMMFHHFTDLFIGSGLLYMFIASIGDWQASISLRILIMFAILRGASLLEDIKNKKESRRAKKIDNDQSEWENQQKRK